MVLEHLLLQLSHMRRGPDNGRHGPGIGPGMAAERPLYVAMRSLWIGGRASQGLWHFNWLICYGNLCGYFMFIFLECDNLPSWVLDHPGTTACQRWLQQPLCGHSG